MRRDHTGRPKVQTTRSWCVTWRRREVAVGRMAGLRLAVGVALVLGLVTPQTTHAAPKPVGPDHTHTHYTHTHTHTLYTNHTL